MVKAAQSAIAARQQTPALVIVAIYAKMLQLRGYDSSLLYQASHNKKYEITLLAFPNNSEIL